MSGERKWTKNALDSVWLDIFAVCSCSQQHHASCQKGLSRPEADIENANVTQTQPVLRTNQAQCHPSPRSSATTEYPLGLVSSASSAKERCRVEASPLEWSSSGTNDVGEDWEGLGSCEGLAFQLGGDALPSPSKRKSSGLSISEALREAIAMEQTPDAKPVSENMHVDLDSWIEQKTLHEYEPLPDEETSGACDEFGEFQAAFCMDTNDSDTFGEFQSAVPLQDAGDESFSGEQALVYELLKDAASVDSVASNDTAFSFAEANTQDDWPCHACNQKTEEALGSLTLCADTITGAFASAIDAEYRSVRSSLHSGGVPLSPRSSALDTLLISTEGLCKNGKNAAKADGDSLKINPQSIYDLVGEHGVQGVATESTATSSSQGSVMSADEIVTDANSNEDLPPDEYCDVMVPTCEPGEPQHSISEIANKLLRLSLLRCASVCS